MASNYNGNLVELRLKREKLLLKKRKLNLELKKQDKMTQSIRVRVFKNVSDLSNEIERVNKEIAKIQKGMQNSDKWMNGDYNIVKF